MRELQPDYLKDLVAPPSPLAFPKFPSLAEVAKQETTTTPTRRGGPGLFQSLVGRPELMHQDAEQYPDKYLPGVSEILRRMVEGKRYEELSREEQDLIDSAVIDFAETPKKKERAPVQPPPEQKATPVGTRRGSLKKQKTEKPRPGIDVPVTELPAYWWL